MKKNGIILGSLVLLGFGLSACDFHQETYMTSKKIQVEQSQMNYDLDVHDFNDSQAAIVAHKYENTGAGPIRVTVTYDSGDPVNSAGHANKHLARALSSLRRNGANDVLGSIMPVHEAGKSSRLLITFDSYVAKAPKDCSSMPGLRDNDISYEREYELGCGRQSLIAKQVARPKDLLGQGTNAPLVDGRRAANTLEGYRAAVPNEPLQGESASGGD